MFDKMHLRADEPVNESNLLSLGFHKHHGDDSYKTAYTLQLPEGKRITVKTQSHYQSAKDSIELNPSKFQGWSQVSSLLAAIGPQEQFLIDRLDYAVDLQIPYLKIRETIRIQRKSNRERYRENESDRSGRNTGFRSGEKPEIFCIYDKGYEYSKRFKFKSLPGAEKGVATRIEARHFNKKVPFRFLRDIRCYLEHNPFEKIESYELNEEFMTKDKIQRLRRDIQLVGFQGIFHELNLDGNFKRTWGKYFIQKPLSDQLASIHRSSCSAFLDDKPIKEMRNNEELHTKVV